MGWWRGLAGGPSPAEGQGLAEFPHQAWGGALADVRSSLSLNLSGFKFLIPRLTLLMVVGVGTDPLSAEGSAAGLVAHPNSYGVR